MNNTQSLAELPPFYRGCVLVFGFAFLLAWVWSARLLRRTPNDPASGPALVIFWAPFVLALCWLVGVVTA